MSKKHFVCHGATCKCQYGTSSDKIAVLTQSRHYINDGDLSEKLIATHVDIGQPFEKKTFGKCKLQPTSSGYLPCVPAITQWTGMYENITYQDNSGKPLLEDSKATCAIAGAPCVEITNHGQTSEVGQQNIDNANGETLAELNPMVDMKSMNDFNPNIDQ